jgi:hypothetical protein
MLLNVVAILGLIAGGFGFVLGVLLNSGAPTARGLKFGRVLDYTLGACAVLLLIEFSLVFIGA